MCELENAALGCIRKATAGIDFFELSEAQGVKLNNKSQTINYSQSLTRYAQKTNDHTELPNANHQSP